MVLPDSHGISRAPCYSGIPKGGRIISSTGVAPSVPGLSMPFDYDTAFSLHRRPPARRIGSHNPGRATPGSCHTRPVWPHPLSLATTHGISLPVGTEMFHFPTFPPHTLYIQVRVARHDSYGVPPFGHPRITVRLPTPRGLSQATTSFFGSWCQGIHPVLLKNHYNNTRQKQTPAKIYGHTTHRPPTTNPPERTRTRPPARTHPQRCSRPLYSSQTTDPQNTRAGDLGTQQCVRTRPHHHNDGRTRAR